MIIFWIFLGILALLVLYVIIIFNRLIVLRMRTNEAWSDIKVQMKRRYDLIPNLVTTVKGYASHEKAVFENVTKARSVAMGAETPGEKIKAENELTKTIKSLFAVAENYPQLRASENFQKLQEELTGTEDKIEASRRFYNANVRDFNTAIQVFPSNMIAPVLGFKNFDLFELAEGEKEAAGKAPEVKF